MTGGQVSASTSAGPVARSLIITIDTEGDDLWSRPSEIKVENARFVPRFQKLCEVYGMKPVYLTNYEMATCGAFQEFARDGIRRGTAEVGMHLHAWNNPPAYRLTPDDYARQPYLIEYPTSVMRDKIAFLTDTLEDVFGTKMLSHRAGRWAFNGAYASLLLARGYQSDCSVTPGISWHATKGDPNGQGGSDYRSAPLEAYFVDPQDVSRPGTSSLLEVPMTIRPCRWAIADKAREWFRSVRLARRFINSLCCPATWLRPNGRNLGRLLGVLSWAIGQGRDYVEFMLHSSELMPGGSPTFAAERDIEKLYEDMEAFFASAVSMGFVGCTLAEYRKVFQPGR